MSEYLVTWEIQLDADSPEDAAHRALETQRDPDSIATVFGVTDETTGTAWTVDLTTAETTRL
jgi:hypothetical protein